MRDSARTIGPPAHAGGELSGSFACEHQMRMAVDESGDHAGVLAADPMVGVGRVGASAHPWRCAGADDHQRGVGDDAERVAIALGGVVGDELADVGAGTVIAWPP